LVQERIKLTTLKEAHSKVQTNIFRQIKVGLSSISIINRYVYFT